MKSLKDQLNYVNNRECRRINEDEQTALKKCIIDIYTHVNEICESNGLSLMLAGGSCLGAIRHSGFIPWDDDLDLMMSRKEYNRLLELCEEGALGDDYEYTFPHKKHDSPNAFLKIYMKHTRFIALGGEHTNFPKGVFIDVFPIEGAPSSFFHCKLKGFFADLLRLCANMVNEKDKWNSDTKLFYKQDRRLYLNMKCRQLIGKIISIVNHKTWVRWYDSFVQNEEILDNAVIPTGRKLYAGETLPSVVFFPPSKGVFEGVSVKLPADPAVYLKNLYGDYMKIPPVEKRESHFIIDLLLPERYYS